MKRKLEQLFAIIACFILQMIDTPTIHVIKLLKLTYKVVTEKWDWANEQVERQREWEQGGYQ